MQNIGLLMTYNEDDIIEEMMIANQRYFDAIFVLDGSSDKTEEIIRSFNNVKYVLKDKDIFPQRKITDGARQFLLEKAQAMYGYDGWFTILHGDEIMVDNPNEIAARAEAFKAERVNWHSLNFFLHSSQRTIPFDPKKSIQEQVIYYHPGTQEIRQFKNKQGLHYDLNQMSNVVPCGVGLWTLLDFPILKHYIIRSVQQKQKRPTSGLEVSRASTASININLDDVYKDKLSGHYKQVRKFEGSFEEFAPGKRPRFATQWYNWRNYRAIEYGIWSKFIPQSWKV